MKIKKKTESDGRILVRASASAREADEAINHACEQLARSLQLTPSKKLSAGQAIQEKLGISDIASLILPNVLSHLVALAIDKSGIEAAYIPDATKHSPLVSGKPFDFEFLVTPKPHLDLSSFEPVRIVAEAPTLSDADIEAELELYQDFLSTSNDPDKETKLRKLVFDKLYERNEQSFELQKRQRAVIELAKRLEGDIPDDALAHMRDNIESGMREQAAQQGMTFEEFVDELGGKEQADTLLLWNARETLRQSFALDAFYRHEGLEVTQEDLERAAEAMAPSLEPKAAIQYMRKMGRMHTLKETAQRMKANDRLLEQAIVEMK